ncbi:class I SAM-dependent methyltransferase [Pseudarthrobacter sp. J1738]|uniref:class I SAM-dependent methyltransferase n=1 Tax=Pseudarthrobacter sp. J1738 TaxID=3420446 RepID=UPI003D2CB634
MVQLSIEDVFSRLRRFPDVEAQNLHAHDATDRLLIKKAFELEGIEENKIAIIGDRYGALTLALAAAGHTGLRTSQDLASGQQALAFNAGRLGLNGTFTSLALGEELLKNAKLVLLQLPRSLAELEEIADAIARYAAPDAILIAGGRVKHMTPAMNQVLAKYFKTVQAQLAQQKSRLLIAQTPLPVPETKQFPFTEHHSDLDLTVAAYGAVFAGNKLDIGTRFLVDFLPKMAPAQHIIDLGCGTGVLAAMVARRQPKAHVIATDQSAAAVASAQATMEANNLADRVECIQADAMEGFPPQSADLILLNPPFHLGASVHAGAATKLFDASSKVLVPGGELWTVFNTHLDYVKELERKIGATRVVGRNNKFTVTVSRQRSHKEN